VILNLAPMESKKRKREEKQILIHAHIVDDAPLIPCLDIVLSYLPYVELGDLAADAKSPCLVWEEWQSAFRADYLWKEASKGSFETYSFFQECKRYLQDSIPLSQAKGMAENSYREFFFNRIYLILKYLRLYEEEYKISTGKEWTRELDSELCLNSYFLFTKKRSEKSRSYIGTNIPTMSQSTFENYREEFFKNRLFVGQFDCSLFKGSLTSAGLLPTTGMLYCLLLAPSMDQNGGSLIYSPDNGPLDKQLIISDGEQEDGVEYPKRNITGIREILVHSQNSKLDYQLENSVNERAQLFFTEPWGQAQRDYFFGHKSTSQQGYNTVEADQFLVLQADFYGEQFMDGIENYFILPKAQLLKEPKDFSCTAGNFSLYANC